MPTFLWLGAIVFVLTAYLGYAYWDKYKSIFTGPPAFVRAKPPDAQV
jgi:hypothetical protein